MKFLLSILLLLSFSAYGAYHRFYRGFTILEQAKFLETLNKDFFPLFQEAHPLGLVHYRPFLLSEENLPHEIVILTFTNQKTYDAYSGSPVGQRIRAAHAPVFDSGRSRSLVPEPFRGKVSPEHAYLMREDPGGEVSGALVLHGPFGTVGGVSPAVASAEGKNAIVLVAENYVVEYLFADNDNDLDKLRSERCSGYKSIFSKNHFVKLKKQKIGSSKIGFGEGMDAQF